MTVSSAAHPISPDSDPPSSPVDTPPRTPPSASDDDDVDTLGMKSDGYNGRSFRAKNILDKTFEEDSGRINGKGEYEEDMEEEGEAESLMRDTRRHSIDSADSVQNYELYTPEEDKSVLKKLDRRLVGFMALLYCLSFLDRSSMYDRLIMEAAKASGLLIVHWKRWRASIFWRIGRIKLTTSTRYWKRPNCRSRERPEAKFEAV
jgi:hypothetical protein